MVVEEEEEGEGYPGQTLVSSTLPDIEINPGRSLIELSVANTGDRPIQVGSHYREFVVAHDNIRTRRFGFAPRLPSPRVPPVVRLPL